MRAIRMYLERLGGTPVADDELVGDGWRVTLESDTVSVGPTLELTEITLTFEGDADQLDEIVPAFAQKAMRAGG